MPRFVILAHDWPFPHWDLMLEAGEVLNTWRLLEEPEPGRTINAQAVADHRVLYLDYEGPVSGGRGVVTQWDAGEFEWTGGTGNQRYLTLNGARLSGPVQILNSKPGRTSVSFGGV